MLFVSGDSQFFDITHKVYEFFTESYEISSDVEIFTTNLRDDNALGFTEVNGDEQFVQVHNDLTKEEHVKTLLHELVHVVQNEHGMIDDDERESQAEYGEVNAVLSAASVSNRLLYGPSFV